MGYCIKSYDKMELFQDGLKVGSCEYITIKTYNTLNFGRIVSSKIIEAYVGCIDTNSRYQKNTNVFRPIITMFKIGDVEIYLKIREEIESKHKYNNLIITHPCFY